MIQFTIPGQPVSKKRPRFSAWSMCLKCKQRTMSRSCPKCGCIDLKFLGAGTYAAKESEIYENLVAQCAQQAMQGQPLLCGAVKLSCVFTFLPAESRKCKHDSGCPKKLTCKKLHTGDVHTQKPDLDNLLKSICDGLNRVVWGDDSVVSSISARKEWGHPSAEVTVEPL
jgi:Holliday junction resolvase RusA-like endonuclease